MAEFDYINTPFGELEYLIPNFEAMMRGTKPEATANLASRADAGTGYINSIIGADAVLGESTVEPRYGLSYKDNDNLKHEHRQKQFSVILKKFKKAKMKRNKYTNHL